MTEGLFDLPCGVNCEVDCEIKNKMETLQSLLVPLQPDAATQMVQVFFAAWQKLYQSSEKAKESYAPTIALPALFDLITSAKYAERQIANGGWTYCAGSDNEEPALYFPFLKTCPRCSVKRGYKPITKSNKPESDPIGEIACDATAHIIAEMLRRLNPNVHIGKISDRQHDVDLVIYDDQIIALGEIKSSPLAVYPLEIKLAASLTEVLDGISGTMKDHSAATAMLTETNLFLYIPHIETRINLGKATSTGFPFLKLTEFVSEPKNVALLISAWNDLFQVYAQQRKVRVTRKNPADKRKWLLCGCGSTVDDSKNAPGMDRTDDIKKGTYQALKYGAYYKDKCPRRLLRAVLISNLLPLHGFSRYLAEMIKILWTKEQYEVELNSEIEEVRAFRTDSVFQLYDALVCLTGSVYNDPWLEENLSYKRFSEKFGI